MRNDDLLNHSVNKTFEELLWMTDENFTKWVKELREVVVDLWDNKGLPPRVGFSEDEIIDQFRKMTYFPVHEFETLDLDTGKKNIIRNTSVIGNAVNEWFPTMMKTRITTSNNAENSKSIYDWFKEPELFDRFKKYAYRNLKRDSFYHYSNPIGPGMTINLGGPTITVGDRLEDFVEAFEMQGLRKYGWDYFVAPVKSNYEYTGYNSELKKRQNFTFNLDTLLQYAKNHQDLVIPPVVLTVAKDSEYYQLRVFKYGQKIFPIGLKAFKVTFSQYAVNFPPLTAKYLYQKYTKHIKGQDVIKLYDPSAGWGGRLVGALSLDSSQKYLYIGTDPNTDHVTSPGKTKYDEITGFYNGNIREINSLYPEFQESEIYSLGSEVIANDERFRRHRGSIDMVFTSPPYFSKEVYSDDVEQSCHKFSDYEAWKQGFLRPTLETAVDWLKPDRYLLWNIADIQVGNKMLPLEQDSRDILEGLGMDYVETLKMALAAMPGSNRFEVDGESEDTEIDLYGERTVKNPILKGKMKNFCRILSKTGKPTMLKFEPILVYYKP